jgi:Zn-dependent protease
VSDSTPAQLESPPPETAVGQAPAADIVQADVADKRPPRRWRLGRRRLVLPVMLFFLTCASTFFAGATGWMPDEFIFRTGEVTRLYQADFLLPARLAVLQNWPDGLIYMGCLIGILLTHEMGHFVMTVVYRVRASLPFFVPFPLSPLGTLGAVIGMDGSQANRRQMFDIGLAGPLAGLVVALPIIWIGAAQLDLKHAPPSNRAIELPLAMRLLVDHLHPGEYQASVGVPLSALNPYLMAGWVGLLVTALNMMPVSQLDGGHVTYALFGKQAHWLARGFMGVALAYVAFTVVWHRSAPSWILMILLVLIIGTDHPRTSDDSVPLGWFRMALGLASLAIPIFCFVPNLFP